MDWSKKLPKLHIFKLCVPKLVSNILTISYKLTKYVIIIFRTIFGKIIF